MLTTFFGALSDVVFPASCGACQSMLSRSGLFCDRCQKRAEDLPEPLCDRCGVPLAEEPCPDCAAFGGAQETASGFDLARARYRFATTVETAIVRAKFAGAPHVATMAGQHLGQSLCRGELLPQVQRVDCVVPIPVGRLRLRSRGYDQSVLMAKKLARTIGKPALPYLLSRTRETQPQATLQRQQRLSNVEGAFVARRDLAGQTVLVVDDVLTTGSTAHAAATALKQAGAGQVWVVTLARAL